MAYPSNNTDKAIILHGTPLFYALGARFDEGTTSVVHADSDPASALSDPDDFRLLFDNVKRATAKIVVKGTTDAGENIDIEAADGAVTRFPKASRIVDGRDDEEILTDAENDENATGYGEITVEVNQGDLDHSSWTAFLAYLYDNKDNFWFLVLPVGFNYNKRYVADTKKADGYIYMLAKIGSDIELTMENAPQSLNITFLSYKFASSSSLFATSMAYSAFTNAITGMRLKGTNPVVTITPETLDSDDSEKIAKGYPVLKAAS